MGARVVDFSGGMNNTIHPALLGESESVLIQSHSLDEKGTLTPVRGRRLRYPGVFSSDPTNGIARYVRSDGVSRLLIGSGHKLFTDTPRLVTSFDSLEDWETGDISSAIDSTTQPGTLTIKAPVAGDLSATIGVGLSSGAYDNAEYSGGALKLTKMGVDYSGSLTPNATIPQRVPLQNFSPVLANGSGTNYAIDSGVVSLSKVVS